MVDVKTIIEESQEKMDMAVMYLEEALAHIRAGKASTRLLDGIRVDSYGSMVPISNVAAVTTPDARSITIKPWDKSMFRVIEKAIIDSDLGIMPENNGEIIRIGIPPLTEERRKQLAKQCKAEGETAKVSIRNARRDGIDALKKALTGTDLVYCAISGESLPVVAANLVKVMPETGITRLLFMGAVGIYNEIPAEMDGDDNVDNEPAQIPNRDAVDIVEASNLNYTVLRPGYLREGNPDDYVLTVKGEAAKGYISTIPSVIEFVKKLIADEKLYSRESVSITKNMEK